MRTHKYKTGNYANKATKLYTEKNICTEYHYFLEVKVYKGVCQRCLGYTEGCMNDL
jgi:hypothetical protein